MECMSWIMKHDLSISVNVNWKIHKATRFSWIIHIDNWSSAYFWKLELNTFTFLAAIGMSIGQNVAGGYRSWEQAVQMWWDEIDMWTYGVDPDSYLGPGGWKKIGHFTQVHILEIHNTFEISSRSYQFFYNRNKEYFNV